MLRLAILTSPPARHVHRCAGRTGGRSVVAMAWACNSNPSSARIRRRALRRRRGSRDRAAEGGRRPRCGAQRARPGGHLAHGPLPAVRGVRAAIGDVSIPARLGDKAAVAHGWSSVALTPYVLTAGRPPVNPDEVVTRYPPHSARGCPSAATEPPARSPSSASLARAIRDSAEGGLFDRRRGNAVGRPSGPVDAIGVLAAPARRRPPARRRSGLQVLTGQRAREGRVPGAPEHAHDTDPRHGGIRRSGDVHRDVRRSQHAGPVDPAA